MRHPSQNGNVLFIILIGIVLFAGLMYAFTESSQNSFSNLDREQAQIVATDILNYGQKVESGVQRLLAKGCSELDISFENSLSTTDYTNVNSVPGEYNCHVFRPEGAGLTYIKPPQGANNSSEWVFNAGNKISGIGDTDLLDFTLILREVNENVCNAINLISGVTSSLSDEIPRDGAWYNRTPFDGDFPASINSIGMGSVTGATSVCFESQNHGGYHFYHVLIAR